MQSGNMSLLSDMDISRLSSVNCWWMGEWASGPSTEVWEKSQRTIDGRGSGRVASFGDVAGGGSGWVKTGGERNEKSDGTSGSPFRVCGVY